MKTIRQHLIHLIVGPLIVILLTILSVTIVFYFEPKVPITILEILTFIFVVLVGTRAIDEIEASLK